LVGGSAIDCECGHVFDASTIVVRKPPKLCPFCGVANPATAQTCHCGRHFDLDPDQSRAVVRRRMRYGVFLSVVGLAGLVGAAVAFMFAGFVSAWPLIGGALIFSNGMRVCFTARRVLETLPAPLPQAVLRERR
jgi:hypothetical protein